MFSLIVHLHVDPAGREEFLAAITVNAQASVRDEPGCQRFDVCSVDGDPDRFVLYELYDDAEAFAAHKAAPHFADWRAVASRVVLEQNNTPGQLLATNTSEVTA
ncbi:Quinol monooxygenase YgiN [Klenkia soli]|uniref:Quinol monooxygenase YgiN n=1 Tax=Klenkia soli TaxID=1052260 RepID=A0A1H0GPX1_9ACTN|nr:antibiotic biosynthesis monooxygenase [Klenkia soli]SDO08862.1 Quinol monooxygenase YgiN [Klenkia soli]